MNKKVVVSFFLLCVALTVMSERLAAQDSDVSQNTRIGTASASELLIPVGSRELAMGGAGLATSNGLSSLHWNPAGLGRIGSSAEGMFATMSYIGDTQLNYGAVGVNFGGFGVLALSVRSLDLGEIALTTNDDPEGRAGRTYSPAFVTVGMSYSRAFTDAITAGGTIKLISEKMGRVTGSGFALDFGVQYRNLAGFKGLHMGVAMKNIGPQMGFSGPGLLRRGTSSEGSRPEQFYTVEAASFELPSSVEIGLAYERSVNESLKWSVNSAFANNNLGLDGYRFGGEAVYAMDKLQLAARGGMEISPTKETDEQIFGPTAGFGIFLKTESVDLTLDYAYRSVEFFDSNQMFTLRFGF